MEKYTYKDISSVFDNNKLARLQSNYDEAAIKNSLINLFVIQKNTVPGKPWFGNPLNTDLFDLFNNTTEDTMLSAIQNTVAIFEPRITVKDISITFLPEYNRIIAEIYYVFVFKDHSINGSVEIPFNHNNHSYLDGRETKTI